MLKMDALQAYRGNGASASALGKNASAEDEAHSGSPISSTGDEERHTCPHAGCGRSYARREHLKRHLKVHNGAEPSSCRICGRRFYRKDHLKHHELAHTDDRPYVCAEEGCGRTYRQRCSLSQHQRTTGHNGRVDRTARQRQEMKAAAAAAAASATAGHSAAVDRARATAQSHNATTNGSSDRVHAAHGAHAARFAYDASPLRYAPPVASAAGAMYSTTSTPSDMLSPLAIRRPEHLHSALRLPGGYGAQHFAADAQQQQQRQHLSQHLEHTPSPLTRRIPHVRPRDLGEPPQWGMPPMEQQSGYSAASLAALVRSLDAAAGQNTTLAGMDRAADQEQQTAGSGDVFDHDDGSAHSSATINALIRELMNAAPRGGQEQDPSNHHNILDNSRSVVDRLNSLL